MRDDLLEDANEGSMDRAARISAACSQAPLVPPITARPVRLLPPYPPTPHGPGWCPSYRVASGRKFQFISALKTSGNS